MLHSWLSTPQNPDRARLLSHSLDLHPALCQVLINRGLTEPEPASGFLNPSLKEMANPFDLPDLEEGSRRLAEAVIKGRKIGLFGDYDADGVTSTAIFYDFFRALGTEVRWRVPNRLTEGYGLNLAGIREMVEAGVKVLVTADCGTTDHEALRAAKAAGLEIILTDHHQLGPEEPLVEAFINPHRPDAPQAFKGLAGVGVVFFLLAGVRAKLREAGFFNQRPEPNLKDHLDLVTLGTLADVVPVTGQNRVIMAPGLRDLAAPRRPGMAALFQVARLGPHFAHRDVTFALAPRINAAGRMGQAELGVELLTAIDFDQALELAKRIDRLNQERKKVEAKVLAQALDQLRTQGDPAQQLALVAASENWHSGVLGIVAARLSRKFHRPCFILRIENGTATGSGRSIRPFSLHAGLARLEDLLIRYGGHSQAAGLTIEADLIDRFAAALSGEVGRELSPDQLIPTVEIDTELHLDDLGQEVMSGLDQLGPFGPGNPEPLFYALRVGVLSAKRVGAGGEHLKMKVRQGRRSWSAIGFGLGSLQPHLNSTADLAFKPIRSAFSSGNGLEIQVESIRI